MKHKVSGQSIMIIRIAVVVFLISLIFSACDSDPSPRLTEEFLEATYTEKHRPQFHFSPPTAWMNDPNGMFYQDGQYHLFYQYYPDSTVWGPMHWGHALSRDLVHWEHLPIALYPDELGCIFSGGAVVDVDNTSQLAQGDESPVVATFTHHNFAGEKAQTNDFQSQSLAYSLDGGVTWEKYDGNPVIPNTEKIKDFRDPKVVWHEPSQMWILVLAAYDKARFYRSADLLSWEYISEFGIEGDTRLWECPDLFPMTVEGTGEQKWVLIVSIQKEAPNGGTATSYFVGDFDGRSFTADVEKQKWLDYGPDNYAFVTWNNVPADDGRVLGLGWMSNWQYAQIVPTEEWRSAMTVSRALSLHGDGGGYKIHSTPVKELEKLRRNTHTLDGRHIVEDRPLEIALEASASEFIFDVDLSATTSKSFSLQFMNDVGEHLVVTFDKEDNQMLVDRTHTSKERFSDVFYDKVHRAPLDLTAADLRLQILLDASSIEIFADDGSLVFTSIFFPSEDFDRLQISALGGTCVLEHGAIYALSSIWKVTE